MLCLREKLGPLLWQLPPSFKFDPDKLAAFFELLPRDTNEAAKLARSHDHRTERRAWTKTDRKRRLRHALEARHDSFVCEAFIKLLRKYSIALVVADTAGKWPFLEDATSDFIYVRLHGDSELYVSGYTDKALQSWQQKVGTWSKGGTPRDARRASQTPPRKRNSRDVFVYFDNDAKVRAPFDAMSLAHRLGLGAPPPPFPKRKNIGESARTEWPAIACRWKR